MAGFKERVKEFVQEHDLADEITAELSYDPSIVGAVSGCTTSRRAPSAA